MHSEDWTRAWRCRENTYCLLDSSRAPYTEVLMVAPVPLGEKVYIDDEVLVSLILSGIVRDICLPVLPLRFYARQRIGQS